MTRTLSFTLSLGCLLALTGCFAKIHQLPAHTDQSQPVFAPLPDRDTLVGQYAGRGEFYGRIRYSF